jgi:hypothetical protein
METEKASRVVALDMTKGVLVAFMVLYHSLNYTTQYFLAFRYMAFLPPSFILIVGFLLSSVYSTRYRFNDWRLYKRLLQRGFKLILLFTLLNIAALVSRGEITESLQTFFRNAFDIYAMGAGRFAAFEILLPIGYLLMLAPALIFLNYLHRLALPAIAVCLFAVCAVLDHSGASSLNLNMLGAGTLGMVLGRCDFQRLNLLGRFWPVALLAYCIVALVGAVTGQTYLCQILGACAALALIYGLCVKFQEDGWLQGRLLRLGQYSLVSYIVQIGLLQIFVRLLGRPELWSAEFLLFLFGTLSIMTLFVEAVEWARTRSLGVETLYRAVFA